MARYPVQAASQKLSRLLDEVQQGQEVVIMRDQEPVARLVPVAPATPRQFGQLSFHVPDCLDDPLPADELAGWN